MKDNNNKAIILFDGECNLCNGSVQFISERDHKNYFNFISLQSDEAKKIMAEYGENIRNFNSILLVMDNKIISNSSAVFKITRHLSGLWPLLYGFMIIPEFIRDSVYKLIAKRRYKWFGIINNCSLKE